MSSDFLEMDLPKPPPFSEVVDVLTGFLMESEI